MSTRLENVNVFENVKM